MQNEEQTVETQDETQEGQEATAEETTEESQSEDTVETPEQATVEQQLAHAKAEAAKYRRLLEKSQKTPTRVTVKSQQIDIDERVLKAQGMPDIVLKQLKDVAKLRGLSLIDAQSDPLFQAAKEQVEQEEKSKKAQLGASRGAAKTAPKKNTLSPNLSREEHMALTREIQ